MSSLLKVKNLTRVFRRRLTLPNDGMPLNPNPIIEEFVQEKHAGHLVKPAWISLLFIIPPLSVYAFYLEYQHLFVHRHRRPFPKMYFLHQGVNSWPNGDHKHSPMHHPYWNFTPNGYETDKDGNKLPPGVYAME